MKLILVDDYQLATQRLLENLDKAAIDYKVLAIHYDGFLPETVLNPFAEIVGAKNQPIKHLYFNQVSLPKFAEIRHENGNRAQILQGDHLVGYIYYASHHSRLVKEVQWLNRKEELILSEHYNQQGKKYAQSVFDEGGKEVKTLYFKENDLVGSFDHLSRSIELFQNHLRQSFENLTDFVVNYVKNLPIDFDEVIYNNLSTPCFVANRLPAPSTLYFQEVIKDKIPGNMLSLLEGKMTTKRILFENEKELKKVQKMAESCKIDLAYLGAIEYFRRKNTFRSRLLTLTRSDQILYDEAIASQFPDLKWTIAAPSDISEKLRQFGERHPNVTVLEQIKPDSIDALLADHDIYLDLNRGNEVDSVVQRAYLEGMITMTDQKVCKNPFYELVLVKEDEILAALARKDKAFILNALHQKKGKLTTPTDWRTYLKNTLTRK